MSARRIGRGERVIRSWGSEIAVIPASRTNKIALLGISDSRLKISEWDGRERENVGACGVVRK